jgi:hypothetical protein
MMLKFLAIFQIYGSLGCQRWVVIPKNVKKCQYHCTLLYTHFSLFKPFFISLSLSFIELLYHVFEITYAKIIAIYHAEN